jgi:two-component system CheB/CheR fusion protein
MAYSEEPGQASTNQPSRRKRKITRGSNPTSGSQLEEPAVKIDDLDKSPSARCVVVGIGASAGELDACGHFFSSLPKDTGMAFVVVQHLDQHHENRMAELLSRHTSMPVSQVANAMVVQPNHVYVIPPDKFACIRDEVLYLDQPVTLGVVRLPIDYFFASLAESRKERAIAVLLSGTGSDGACSMQEIKALGGMTLVQSPETADCDGTPRAPIAAGAADFVLPIDDIADVVVGYALHPYVDARPHATLLESAPEYFRAIIKLLHTYTGQDFSRYKKGTLTRRIERRMGIHHISRPSEYLDMLRADDSELHSLFMDMLIGVTRFFRDGKSWIDLEAALAIAMNNKHPHETFRVWVPGCATGEEAYSIAILLSELQKRRQTPMEFQVFATDIDADAIGFARRGLYPQNIIKDLPDQYLNGYFQHVGESLRVRRAVRERCVFATQNILCDPPFSNLDMVACRNLLIYLEPDLQASVCDTLYVALRPEGILFLGGAESLGTRKGMFKTISQSAKIFCKAGANRLPPASYAGGAKVGKTAASGTSEDRQSGYRKPVAIAEIARRGLLKEFAPASVVVDQHGLVHYMHGSVQDYLDFPSGDPELKLGLMARYGLQAKIREVLRQLGSLREPLFLFAPAVRRDADFVPVRIQVRPLPHDSSSEPLYLVSFLDGSAPEALAGLLPKDEAGQALPVPLSAAQQTSADTQLAMELQATREDLKSTTEEFERANEELKSSNQEILSINQELQSTVRELETSQEELQSLNGELSTVNYQLVEKVAELEDTTNNLSNLLSSIEMPAIFLDRKLRIRLITPATNRLMHILPNDMGRPVSDLLSQVNDATLVADAQAVLDLLTPVEKEVVDTRNCYMRRITPFRTARNEVDGVVVVYNDISNLKRASRRLHLRERQQAAVAELGTTALAGAELHVLFEQAATTLAQTLDVEFSKILQLVPEGPTLELVAGVGWSVGLIGNATVPIGAGSQAGFTLCTAEPVIVRELATEKRFVGSPLLTDHDVVSGMSVIIGPLQSPWGVLGVHSTRRVDFTIDDINFVVAITNMLWETIQRRNNETSIKRHLAEIDTVFQSVPIGLTLIDTDLRYVRINQFMADINGRPIEEHLGRTIAEMLPALASTVEPIYRRVIATQKPQLNVEVEGITPGSRHQKRNWLVSYTPLIDDDEVVGVIGAVSDITQRIQAQRALAASQTRLQRLVDLAPAGIAFISADPDYLQANDAMLRIFGLARSDFQRGGWEWWSRLTDSQETFSAVLARLSVADTTEEMQIVWRDKNRRPTWVLIGARTLDDACSEYVVCATDISAQKYAEFALAQSEERLTLAARAAGFGTYYGDVISGEVYWSDEMKAIMGMSADDPAPIRVGEVSNLVYKEDRARVAQKVKESLDPAGDGEFVDEHRIVRPNGEIRWRFVQGRTVFLGKGALRRPSRMAGIVIDTTQRRHMDEQLKEARRVAEAANAAKTTFLANMSHEIRTPMTAILGYADVLDVRLEDADSKACIQTIKQNGVYLCELLDDILDLSRIEAGKVSMHPERCSLPEMLEDMRSTMTVRATQRNLDLSVEFASEIPQYIETDARSVRQVLFNLVGNAIKFTDRGSVRIVSKCIADAELIEIKVLDTGIGIEAKEVERLFKPFEQLDDSLLRSKGGSGLGLSISKHLVELLGGDIAVSSEPGVGSTFTFTFKVGSLHGATWLTPANLSALDTQQGMAVAEHSFCRLPAYVLLADDRYEIRLIVREFLQVAGAQLDMVENGQQLLQCYHALVQSGEVPDAILMDLQMPVIDGLQAARQLRADGYKGPLIALSANVMERDRELAAQAGFDDFIPKPIDRSRLLAVLQSWITAEKAASGEGKISLLCVDDDASTRIAQQRLLEHRGFVVKSARNTAEALTTVETFTPSAVLIDLHIADESGADLLAKLKSRPSLEKTFFICLTGRQESEVNWASLGFDCFCQKPVNMQDLEKIVREGLR